MKISCKFLMRPAVVLMIACAVFSIAASARQPEAGTQPAVRWRMSVAMTSATEGVVTLRAKISPGWHLYGTELPADGPRPTVFDFDASQGVVFTAPAAAKREPLTVDDPMFGTSLTWWDADVAFTRPFKVTEAEGAAIKVTVSYMACDNSTCLPPRSNSFTYKIPQK